MKTRKILNLSIYSRKVISERSEARRILDYLTSHKKFQPTHYGDFKPYQKLNSEEDIEKAVDAIVNEGGMKCDANKVITWMNFHRKKNVRCNYKIAWQNLIHDPFSMSVYSIDEEYIKDKNNFDEWIKFAFNLIEFHEAWYANFALIKELYDKHQVAYKTTYGDIALKSLSMVGRRRLDKAIPGIYWGNYFGPFYTDWLIGNKLDNFPNISAEWYENGGVFFTTSQSPFDWDKPETRRLQEQIKQHLGETAFCDIEAVRKACEDAGGVPHGFRIESLQSPRKVPNFPFEIRSPERKPREEFISETKSYFEGHGFDYLGIDQEKMIFLGPDGDFMYITI
jgi:hypothetical protein